jgi:hypothetical protein
MDRFATSKYLIYTCWTTTLPTGGSIAGSLIHEMFAQTEEEAQAHVATLQERAESYEYKNPDTTNRYIYILNNPDWWPKNPGPQ